MNNMNMNMNNLNDMNMNVNKGKTSKKVKGKAKGKSQSKLALSQSGFEREVGQSKLMKMNDFELELVEKDILDAIAYLEDDEIKSEDLRTVDVIEKKIVGFPFVEKLKTDKAGEVVKVAGFLPAPCPPAFKKKNVSTKYFEDECVESGKENVSGSEGGISSERESDSEPTKKYKRVEKEKDRLFIDDEVVVEKSKGKKEKKEKKGKKVKSDAKSGRGLNSKPGKDILFSFDKVEELGLVEEVDSEVCCSALENYRVRRLPEVSVDLTRQTVKEPVKVFGQAEFDICKMIVGAMKEVIAFDQTSRKNNLLPDLSLPEFSSLAAMVGRQVELDAARKNSKIAYMQTLTSTNRSGSKDLAEVEVNLISVEKSKQVVPEVYVKPSFSSSDNAFLNINIPSRQVERVIDAINLCAAKFRDFGGVNYKNHLNEVSQVFALIDKADKLYCKMWVNSEKVMVGLNIKVGQFGHQEAFGWICQDRIWSACSYMKKAVRGYSSCIFTMDDHANDVLGDVLIELAGKNEIVKLIMDLK